MGGGGGCRNEEGKVWKRRRVRWTRRWGKGGGGGGRKGEMEVVAREGKCGRGEGGDGQGVGARGAGGGGGRKGGMGVVAREGKCGSGEGEMDKALR